MCTYVTLFGLRAHQPAPQSVFHPEPHRLEMKQFEQNMDRFHGQAIVNRVETELGFYGWWIYGCALALQLINKLVRTTNMEYVGGNTNLMKGTVTAVAGLVNATHSSVSVEVKVS